MDNFVNIISADGATQAVEADPADSLAQALFVAGHFASRPLCAGLGRCGQCKVRFVQGAPEPLPAELRKLGPEAAAKGWRLACLHPAESGVVVEVPPQRSLESGQGQRIKAGNALKLGLAVDLGTTTLEWQALSWPEPGKAAEVIATGREPNPQLGAGSEVLSRLSFASRPERAEYLKSLIVQVFKRIESDLPGRLSGLAIAGNSVMSCLAAGIDGQSLGRAPYILPWRAGDSLKLDESLPEAYFAPLLGPFIGGDLSAGLTFLLQDPDCAPQYPFLLADLGTNGEFVLALAPEKFLAASVPLGPALEGVGLSCGVMAAPGAVSAFELTPAGLAASRLPEDSEPGALGGITGTGYLSLIAILLKAGLVRRDGSFAKTGGAPFFARLASLLGESYGEKTFTFQGLTLTAGDLEEALKVKAAFNLAVSALLKQAGIGPSGLARLYLAGAFGQYVESGDLSELGFIPPGLSGRLQALGNTSLRGAAKLLFSAKTREFAAGLAAQTSLVDLNSDDFTQSYMRKMVFEYVN